MGHDHDFRVVILKTPYGYLTSTGVTSNINAPDIVALPVDIIGGKYSTMIRRIKVFQKYTTLKDEIFYEPSKCETFSYNCGGCNKICSIENSDCIFWNERDKAKINKLYSV